MAATLTVEVDGSWPRFGVQLAGYSIDGPVTVYRVHEDGKQYPVRSFDPGNVSGGSFFGWDYEAPRNADVYYLVTEVNGSQITTPAVRYDTLQATLRSPLIPQFDVEIFPERRPDLTHARRRSKTEILDRTTPIVRHGPRMAPTGTLRVAVETDEQADELLAALTQSSVFLLDLPGTRFGSQYVSIGDVNEAQINHKQWGETAYLDLPFDVIERPAGAMFGDPTATWQLVVDTHATWQEVVDTYPTWLDLLRGVRTGD